MRQATAATTRKRHRARRQQQRPRKLSAAPAADCARFLAGACDDAGRLPARVWPTGAPCDESSGLCHAMLCWRAAEILNLPFVKDWLAWAPLPLQQMASAVA